jgi:hypothetical protein
MAIKSKYRVFAFSIIYGHTTRPEIYERQYGISLYSQKESTSNVTTVKKKSKAVPLHAIEAHGGKGGTAPTHS